jgi:hypothetical protein
VRPPRSGDEASSYTNNITQNTRQKYITFTLGIYEQASAYGKKTLTDGNGGVRGINSL